MSALPDAKENVTVVYALDHQETWVIPTKELTDEDKRLIRSCRDTPERTTQYHLYKAAEHMYLANKGPYPKHLERNDDQSMLYFILFPWFPETEGQTDPNGGRLSKYMAKDTDKVSSESPTQFVILF